MHTYTHTDGLVIVSKCKESWGLGATDRQMVRGREKMGRERDGATAYPAGPSFSPQPREMRVS